MRPAPIAAALAVALSSAALAAFKPAGGLAHYPDAPARAHVALGPVQALATAVEADPLHPAPTLAQVARARYGAVDALVSVRRETLPSGATLLTGQAARWR